MALRYNATKGTKLFGLVIKTLAFYKYVQYIAHVRGCNNAYYLVHRSKKSLKSVLDKVVNDAGCAVITRRDSEDAEHLSKSIEQYHQGEIKKRNLLNE